MNKITKNTQKKNNNTAASLTICHAHISSSCIDWLVAFMAVTFVQRTAGQFWLIKRNTSADAIDSLNHFRFETGFFSTVPFLPPRWALALSGLRFCFSGCESNVSYSEVSATSRGGPTKTPCSGVCTTSDPAADLDLERALPWHSFEETFRSQPRLEKWWVNWGNSEQFTVTIAWTES